MPRKEFLVTEEQRAKNRAASKRWREKYPEKARAATLKWYAKNPGYEKKRQKTYRQTESGRLLIRKTTVAKMYGISKDEYLAMLAAQDGKCAICGVQDGLSLCVDHCHITGRVRGLLCSSCNNGIARFKDSIHLLIAAVGYLDHTLDPSLSLLIRPENRVRVAYGKGGGLH